MEREKRKIAILSMQRIVNFGSVLQAWSLRELIKEATGADMSFLDIEDIPALKSKKSVSSAADYQTAANYSKALTQRGKRWIIARLSALNKMLICRFMKKELGLGDNQAEAEFDCVVVGSDEVFNHSKDIRLQLHGEVRQAKKLVSYAASCGTALPEDIYPEDISKLRSAMSNYSALSVRDTATENYVSSLFEGRTYRHLDPVLIGPLRKRVHRPVPMKKYLLVYAYGQRIRTDEEIKAIQDFARKKGLKTVAMGGSQFWCDMYLPSGPFRLMDWFYYADCVVTDTFHGIIFSVINHRRFAAISRISNKNKVCGLLTDLGLEQREVKEMKRLQDILEEKIDYAAVDSLLDQERERSIAYLKEQLGEPS